MELITVGHGRLERDELGALLTGAGVERVVDVRSYPGSRANPDAKREELEQWLPAAGIAYRWEPRLGGRRHLRKDEDARSPDTWWRVAAFRAYAAHTRDEDFAAGMTELLAGATEVRTAVMCSESVWWRCHRRLIADVAVLAHERRVEHLMPGGRLNVHEPSPGARLAPDGTLVWNDA